METDTSTVLRNKRGGNIVFQRSSPASKSDTSDSVIVISSGADGNLTKPAVFTPTKIVNVTPYSVEVLYGMYLSELVTSHHEVILLGTQVTKMIMAP